MASASVVHRQARAAAVLALCLVSGLGARAGSAEPVSAEQSGAAQAIEREAFSFHRDGPTRVITELAIDGCSAVVTQRTVDWETWDRMETLRVTLDLSAIGFEARPGADLVVITSLAEPAGEPRGRTPDPGEPRVRESGAMSFKAPPQATLANPAEPAPQGYPIEPVPEGLHVAMSDPRGDLDLALRVQGTPPGPVVETVLSGNRQMILPVQEGLAQRLAARANAYAATYCRETADGVAR